MQFSSHDGDAWGVIGYQTFLHRQSKPRSSIALGGIGAGYFVAHTDGCFREWNIANNIPLGTGPEFRLDDSSMLFFLVKISESSRPTRLLLLQVEDELNSAALRDHQYHYMFPWIKGADEVTCDASVPFVNYRYAWEDEPIQIQLRCWSPLIPENVQDSALPAVFMDVNWHWQGANPADVTVICIARNPVGYATQAKISSVRRLRGESYSGFEASAIAMSKEASDWGTQSVVCRDVNATCYLGWEHLHPFYERLLREQGVPEWDDTEQRIVTDDKTGERRSLTRVFNTVGSLASVSQDGQGVSRFVYSWHFPNLKAQDTGAPSEIAPGYLEIGLIDDLRTDLANKETHLEGHYYSNFFNCAADVAQYCLEHADRLESETLRFPEEQKQVTSIPHVAHLANAQLNTLRTSSWLTRAGDFGILEGINPWKSFAGLATTDVAAYGQIAVTLLYPELDRATWDAHMRLQKPNGVVAHSITKNFRETRPSELSGVRLDMPGQFAALALRAALRQGNTDYLAKTTQAASRALEYVLRERDKNGDGLPDMEGIMCSFDNFPMYGVSPYVAGQFLAGVSTLVRAYEVLGRSADAARWREVLHQGRSTLHNECFNGKYFILSSGDESHPRDEGCLTDQCFGQLLAYQAGAEPVFHIEACQAALQHIFEQNFRPEQGLRNCTWPGDGWLHPVAEDCWVDQANTVWSGCEFAYAALCIWCDLTEIARRVLENIELRHRRWGIVYNHQEFGGHYYRPLAAWGVLQAMRAKRFELPARLSEILL